MRRSALFLFLLLPFLAFAPAKGGPPLIKGSYTHLLTDASGYIYTTTGQELRRYDGSGKLTNTFSDKSLGDISCLDVQGGQRILVFYKHVGMLVLLDNTLTRIGEVLDIRKWGIVDPLLVCLSSESGIWVLDGWSNRLIHLRLDGKEVVASPDLSNLGLAGMPVRLKERENFLMLTLDNGKAHMFDHFGNPFSMIDLGPGHRIKDFSPERIYALNKGGDSLLVRHIKTREEASLALPMDSVHEFSLFGAGILCADPSGIHFVHLK